MMICLFSVVVCHFTSESYCSIRTSIETIKYSEYNQHVNVKDTSFFMFFKKKINQSIKQANEQRKREKERETHEDCDACVSRNVSISVLTDDALGEKKR
jgi:hypothetical protein